MGDARYVAAGGWRRALTAFVLGALAGLAAALVQPRDARHARPPGSGS